MLISFPIDYFLARQSKRTEKRRERTSKQSVSFDGRPIPHFHSVNDDLPETTVAFGLTQHEGFQMPFSRG